MSDLAASGGYYMALPAQAKVLRVLQTGEFTRVGGEKSLRTDCRVVAATNRDLEQMVKDGQFREDLYFRLNVVPIFVPSLRDRQEDIPLLAEHFMAMLAREYGRRPKTFEADALIALRQYAWPGNVRELRNVIERLMIMVPGDRVSSRDLSFLDQQIAPPGAEPAAAPKASVEAPLHEARDRFERDYIVRALASQHGNISRTAELLGIERSNLYRKMRGFGIAPSRRSEDEEPVV
jgi:two-component system nitrogen regulation response regulator NtrX